MGRQWETGAMIYLHSDFLFGSSYLFAFTVGVRCAFEYCGDWWLQALEYVSYFMLCSG
jgi:hypothetical protein